MAAVAAADAIEAGRLHVTSPGAGVLGQRGGLAVGRLLVGVP
jgi:hypothetical protein